MSVEDTQPLITHLIELRKRLLNCIIAVIVIFLCLVYFANDIYHGIRAIDQAVAARFNDDRHRRGLAVLYADQADLYGVADSVSAGDSLSGVGIYRPSAV